MYQQITIVGNLGNDPEMRYTPTGVAVASFSVATSRKWTGADGQPQEKTVWFRVSAWQKTAEICAQYLRKGRQVMIVGEMEEARAFTDKDGNARASLEIRANNVTFLGSRNDSDTGGYTPQPQATTQPQAQAATAPENIPF